MTVSTLSFAGGDGGRSGMRPSSQIRAGEPQQGSRGDLIETGCTSNETARSGELRRWRLMRFRAEGALDVALGSVRLGDACLARELRAPELGVLRGSQ